ncbi:XdhC family protein [Lederbergia wuyishanensis]|uniref:Xanthine dehydrogenase accessory factor n=1 Tax=Lederbergia wuyishanensis TaxID=1347903 RepID=A0ABU0DA95_9BACI|nr:XdhC family protein [Lederbergia wuyishanensis]MCJ8010106.1 XdhC family protein [Lederbergia wuyishanensis]MDQ0345344.1 xanthine dehydrogenase accessory factor [Lederbergia wuyishanensis]
MDFYLHEILDTLSQEHHQPSVLAQITNVEGSSYRKAGAWMLLKEDGSKIGLISGGCLENDLKHRASELFSTGRAEIVEYDLSSEDDLGWGSGAGCNGIVSVLLRDVDDRYRRFLKSIKEQLNKIEPVLFVQSLTNFDQYAFLNKTNETLGDISFEIPKEFIVLLQTTPRFCHYAKKDMTENEAFFLQLIWPKPNLYVVGAGEDVRPFAHLAADMGYSVHILDWREANCTSEFFPSAQSFFIGEPDQVVKEIPLSSLDSVIIMTHDFQRDRKILLHLKELQLFYVGILGSKKRTERLIGGEIPNWLHSPIGLSIGAEGPKEIAISIAAELIQSRRRKI